MGFHSYLDVTLYFEHQVLIIIKSHSKFAEGSPGVTGTLTKYCTLQPSYSP